MAVAARRHRRFRCAARSRGARLTEGALWWPEHARAGRGRNDAAETDGRAAPRCVSGGAPVSAPEIPFLSGLDAAAAAAVRARMVPVAVPGGQVLFEQGAS